MTDTRRPPMHFWCDTCEQWTLRLATLDDEDNDEVRCSVCDEDYQCAECGYQIDADGACLRPADHTVTPCPNRRT